MMLALKPGPQISLKTGNPAGLLFRRIWYSVWKSGVLGITEYRQGRPMHYSVLPRIEKGRGAAWGKRALLFAKLHFKGTFARVIIFWGHIAQIVGNTSYVWNVT